jgi:recombination protein RecT
MTEQRAVAEVKTDKRALSLKAYVEGPRFREALMAALPKTIRPERMLRVVLAAFQSPTLLECWERSPNSCLLAIMRAAAWGLEPDGGALGHGYLVPFWNEKRKCKECQFIPGYRGLVKLARNSGDIADVWAEVVYEADAFNYELGLEQSLTHKRNDDVTDPGPLRFVYAVARFRDGERKFVVMNRREVEAIKRRSSAKDRSGNLVGPWVEHEGEMWKKTAVRRLCKLLPLSVEAAEAAAYEPDPAGGSSSVIPAPSFAMAGLPAPAFEDMASDDDNVIDATASEVLADDPAPGPAPAPAPVDPVQRVAETWFDDCDSLTAVGTREKELWEGAGSEEQAASITAAANAARERIRASRGPRSGGSGK